MTDEQRAKMMMYHRVVVFLTMNAVDFTGTDVATLLAELVAIIGDIHTNAAVQEGGTEPDTADRTTKRRKLRRLCNRFENTGKAIGSNQNDEVIIASFNIQKPYSDMGDEELVTAADLLKTVATPLAAQFQAKGFAATFLADFQAARDAFHDTLTGANTVQATSTIALKIARGDVIVVQFDVTVGNRYDPEDNPASIPKRAAYDSARQVSRTRTQPLEVTLTATRSGNTVTASVTLSRDAEINDTVTLRWREPGVVSPLFTDGPVTTFAEGTTTATATVTVSTANPVEVVARVIRADGSQFDSAAVVV